MLIQCHIKREGGSLIDIGGTTYHFAPNEHGDHVCEVPVKKHVRRFLSIDGGEVYEPYDEPKAVEPAPADPGSDAGGGGDPSDAVVADADAADPAVDEIVEMEEARRKALSPDAEDPLSSELDAMTKAELVSAYGPGTGSNLDLSIQLGKAELIERIVAAAEAEAEED